MNRPMMTLTQAASWMAGAHCVGDVNTPLMRVHADTRTLESGDLFVALQGERFDANDFLLEAQQKGAAAVLCHPGALQRNPQCTLPCIEVPDTRIALGQLAAGWRAQFTLPLIGVTGSNGKTTVTQMLASVLDAYAPDGHALATRGNLNNDIGVPMTLLRLRAHHRIAVVELGMNHPGEIATLAAMAQPTVALVNNAQREHLEFMQTVQAVAEENGCVIAALAPQGVAVFPADDAYTAVWEGLAGTRPIARFAMNSAANALHVVHARWSEGAWQVHAQGLGVELHYRLAIAGRHNVKNSLAAAACALAAGVPASAVVQGLETFAPVKGRSRAIGLQWQGRSLTLVDDTYNANPDSVRAAIDVLVELPGPRLLVLGDMGEVGHEGPHFHAEAGHYAQAKGIEHLITVGELAQVAASVFPGSIHCANMEAAQQAALAVLPKVHSVLVKGSRFMRMEQVVQTLLDHTSVPKASPAC
jgi:UDP-N-acetylmuramoyl-tripeptide--D-alanyl-D-alanine ligase